MQSELHRLQALGVEYALLIGGHQVGDTDHGDRVDRLQTSEAGTVGGVRLTKFMTIHSVPKAHSSRPA